MITGEIVTRPRSRPRPGNPTIEETFYARRLIELGAKDAFEFCAERGWLFEDVRRLPEFETSFALWLRGS